jgi:hypothetical protein
MLESKKNRSTYSEYALWIVYRRHWRGAHSSIDPSRIVQKLKPRRYDSARAIVSVILEIRHPILVHGGAAVSVAKEIERIDKFRADGRCQGNVIAHVPTFAGEMAYRAPAIFS